MFASRPGHVQVAEEDGGGEPGEEPARGGHVRPRRLQHAGRARALYVQRRRCLICTARPGPGTRLVNAKGASERLGQARPGQQDGPCCSQLLMRHLSLVWQRVYCMKRGLGVP